jgi:tRNA nucleotidyltransferase/poly(A) polymerase
LVGGAVRDSILGKQSKDNDFVVCEMPFSHTQVDEALKAIVAALSTIPDANVKEVGKSFGIVKAVIDGHEFDFAIPRMSETKVGDKHTDFVVELDPSATIEVDLGRRDFTMNAVAATDGWNLVDPFGGIADIQAGIIRAVGDPDKRFEEDPLRMLRALQFASRFGFEIEINTWNSLVKNIALLKHVTGERVFEEMRKAYAKSHWKNDFNMLLVRSGAGKTLFGQIAPFSVLHKMTGDELVEVQFIAMFAVQGDFSVLKMPTHIVELIELFRNVAKMKTDPSNAKEPWEFVGLLKHKLPLIVAIVPELSELIGKMIVTPLLPKELAVSGGDLLAAGMKGKEIGEAQRKMLSALWNDKVSNTKEELMSFLQKV